MCLSCSAKKLLLYVPDACDRERLGNQPRWAIIAIVGVSVEWRRYDSVSVEEADVDSCDGDLGERVAVKSSKHNQSKSLW